MTYLANKKSIKRDNVFYFDCSSYRSFHKNTSDIPHLRKYFFLYRIHLTHKILENTECLSYFAESRIVPLPKLNALSRTNHAHSLLLIEVCSCERRGARRAASRLASAPAATHGPIKRSLYPAMCTCPCKRAHVWHTLYPECSALFEAIKM